MAKTRRGGAKKAAKKVAKKKAASTRRATPKKKVAKKSASKKVAKKAASKKVAKKAASKKASKKAATKPASKKAAKKSASKKAAKKSASKKSASKKAAKRSASKKPASKKASKKVAKKSASKKVAKKPASRKKGASAFARLGYAAHPDAGLSARQLKLLHDKLVEVKARKLAELERHMQEALGEAGVMPDETDMAQRHTEQAYLIRFADKERKLLNEIERALEKLRLGEYGVCEGTEEPIGFKRLELRPWTRYSVAYKEQIERERSQHRR